jgi:hypothetical protein
VCRFLFLLTPEVDKEKVIEDVDKDRRCAIDRCLNCTYYEESESFKFPTVSCGVC